MRQKKFLVVIPARKGSKRLKNKNILKINGKSLIQKTIDFALKIENVKPNNHNHLHTESKCKK